MQLVLVCGGRGSRLAGRPRGLPKAMIEIGGEPIVARLCRTLAPRAGPPIFVAAAGDPHVPALAAGFPGAAVIAQPAPDGSGSAILAALPLLVGPALVALGDVVLAGELDALPPAPALVVWPGAPPAATRANFGVRLDADRVAAVVEKPADPAGLLCGLGLYLLTPEVIARFRDLPRDPAGELGITDAIAATLDAGYRAAAFRGRYVNVNDDADLAEAETLSR